MYRATLLRPPSTDEGTFSSFVIPALSLLWTALELPWRDNKPHLSCIAAGSFHCRLMPSTKWSPRPDGLLYQLENVPGRTYIEIHAATFAGDVIKGWHSELLGCIALGKRESVLTPHDGERQQRCIVQSRMALKEFMDVLRGQPFDLDIAWQA